MAVEAKAPVLWIHFKKAFPLGLMRGVAASACALNKRSVQTEKAHLILDRVMACFADVTFSVVQQSHLL